MGSWRSGRPKLTEQFDAFGGMLGIRVNQCKPRDPESKGLVEQPNGHLETSFLPGGRAFKTPSEFNTLTRHRSSSCRRSASTVLHYPTYVLPDPHWSPPTSVDYVASGSQRSDRRVTLRPLLDTTSARAPSEVKT